MYPNREEREERIKQIEATKLILFDEKEALVERMSQIDREIDKLDFELKVLNYLNLLDEKTKEVGKNE